MSNAAQQAELQEVEALRTNLQTIVPHLKHQIHKLTEGDINIESLSQNITEQLRPFLDFTDGISVEARTAFYSPTVSLSDTLDEVNAELLSVKELLMTQNITMRTADERCTRLVRSLIRVLEGKSLFLETE